MPVYYYHEVKVNSVYCWKEIVNPIEVEIIQVVKNIKREVHQEQGRIERRLREEFCIRGLVFCIFSIPLLLAILVVPCVYYAILHIQGV